MGRACSLPVSSCHCLFQENSWIFPTGSRSCLQTVSQQRPCQKSAVSVLVVCVGLWESSVGGLFNIPHVCDCNAASIHIAPRRYRFQDRLPVWNISPVSFIPVWNWAPAWGHAPVSAAAVFIVLHRAGERKEESCQQLPAINRAPRCGWFMMAPAFVACSNTARLKSPYILIFRPLCVHPISASSLAASFSEPPCLISASSLLQRLSISFTISLFCQVCVFFSSKNFIFTVAWAEKREANICCRCVGLLLPHKTKLGPCN